jgi:hypothetical protein
MKTIAICGSMMFAKEMLQIKKKLEVMNIAVNIQEDAEDFTKGKKTNENKWQKIELDPFKTYFNVIKNSDAILVVNLDKKQIKNYIGANTLIEMAFAHILDKKIFLLNPIPELAYADEIFAMKPIILNSELKKIQR